MAVTAAELQVVVGWDDDRMREGSKQSSNHLGGVAKSLGMAAAAAGAVAVSAIGAIGAATMSMQDALMPVGTLVGANSAKFAELSGAIKDVIKSSPADAKDVGMAAYQILSSGISDTKLATDALNASMKLSLAGLGTTEEATNLVTSALNSFKSEGLTADAAAQTLFGTIQSGKTTTADLANGFGQVAPMAATVGIKFSELMSATAAMTGLGSPASTVFAGLRQVMQSILAPTEAASKAAEGFGLDISEAHLKAVGFPKFLEEVREATGGSASALGTMFSGEALGSMVQLTTVARDAFQSNITNLVDSGATLDERAKQVTETLSNRFKILKNNLLVIGSNIGTPIMNAAFGWWEQHGPAVLALLSRAGDGVKAIVLAFKAGGPGVQSEAAGFIGAMERVGLALRSAYDAVKSFIRAFSFKGEIEAGSGEFQDSAERMGLMARRVADAIIQAWPKVREAVLGFVEWFQREILPRATELFQGLVTIVGGVVAFVKEHWPEISATLATVWEAIQSFVSMALALFDLFVEGHKKLWKEWGDEIMAVVNFTFDHIVPIIQTAFTAIKNMLDFFTALFKGDWEAAWNAYKEYLDSVLTAIKQIIRTAFDAVVSLIRDTINRAAPGMFDGIKNAFVDAVNFIINKWNALEFKIPGTGIGFSTPDIKPLSTGGVSFGMGAEPVMGSGGSVLGAGIAYVGERGPERVFLPQGARVEPLGPGGGGGGVMYVTVNMPAGSSGDDVVRALRAYQRRNGSVPIIASAVR